ncbi:hypothetical protein G7Z17_g11908 [Cylindrodendrum hubeiense]|uniref:Uncharacterized protein n=1 Tax=Cylindrodendrum hubeiense TaxID=595255 RepID=A0A9P5H318_9HYPO|nr:hypothetical protein G7Z17_g11908 [Cylindrodendrum hubeiense]
MRGDASHAPDQQLANQPRTWPRKRATIVRIGCGLDLGLGFVAVVAIVAIVVASLFRPSIAHLKQHLKQHGADSRAVDSEGSLVHQVSRPGRLHQVASSRIKLHGTAPTNAQCRVPLRPLASVTASLCNRQATSGHRIPDLEADRAPDGPDDPDDPDDPDPDPDPASGWT